MPQPLPSPTSSAKATERQSNFELLRLLSMLLILVQHVLLHVPGLSDSIFPSSSPVKSIATTTLVSITMVAVNVFVLISGYFGIKLGLKRYIHFFARVSFFTVGIYLTLVALGIKDWDLKFALHKAIPLLQDYWFVTSYTVLMLFAPALNALAEQASEAKLRYILVVILGFVFLFGWLKNLIEFNNGFTGLQLMIVYLIGRYIRLHQETSPIIRWLAQGHRTLYLLFGTAFLSALLVNGLSMLGVFHTEPSVKRIILFGFLYTSPLVHLMSFSLFVYFMKLKMPYVRVINWLAASTLAVYLVHWNNLVRDYFLGFFEDQLGASTLAFLAITSGAILVVFFGSLLIDKIFILLWDKLLDPLYMQLRKQLVKEQD